MTRKIIHVDADCFFAALEMRDNPALRDRPMAVGGHPSRRGVISTCNYLARRFGVHSAMASAQALTLCPALVLVPHRMEVYQQASALMRQIFADYTDLIEPLSLDEAYLDVTDSDVCGGSASRMAEEIRARIAAAAGITVSAGVAPNKFIAKVASDWRKPDGLTVVTPAEVDEFVRCLPVSRVAGIGRVTAGRLQRIGIHTCGNLRDLSLMELDAIFGSSGARIHDLCRGIDRRPVHTSRRRKSLSVEHTFAEDLPAEQHCLQQLPELVDEMQARLQRLGAREGGSYEVVKAFIKVKFRDFTATTVERTALAPSIDDYIHLCHQAWERQLQPVRLLGVGVRFRESAGLPVTVGRVPRQMDLIG
jgi:DNA polymerase-4